MISMENPAIFQVTINITAGRDVLAEFIHRIGSLYDPQCLEKVIQHTVQIIVDPEHTILQHVMDMTTGAKYRERNKFTPLNAPLIRSARIKARIKQARGHKDRVFHGEQQ